MDSEKKSNWCGDCEKGWVKKDAYKKHFTFKTVRSGQGSGGKLIPNMCLNRKRKSYPLTCVGGCYIGLCRCGCDYMINL